MDQPFTMGSWSRICRVPVAELMALEVEFIRIVDHDLQLTPDHVREYFNRQIPPNLLRSRTMSRRDSQVMLGADVAALGAAGGLDADG